MIVWVVDTCVIKEQSHKTVKRSYAGLTPRRASHATGGSRSVAALV